MYLKYILFIIILIFQNNLGAVLLPFKIEKTRDYDLLEKFFRISCTQEEYGYVLEGTKPISIRNFYYPAYVPLSLNTSYSENEILKSFLIFEVIPILKEMEQYEKIFVLKVAPLSVLGFNKLGVEVQFINVPFLEKVIEENIYIFKYILGPTINTKELVNRIAFSQESLSDIFLQNPVLTGIVLGFGSYNSLIGGRQEQINFLSLSRDMVPFASKSFNLNSFQENYGWYYLDVAGGNDKLMSFRIDYTPLIPTSQFLNIKEEIEVIQQLNESLPCCCLDEAPCYRFGAYKGGPSNEKLFDDLKKSQKNIQKLLKQENFLENILTRILELKPCINCKKSDSSALDFPFFKGTLGVNGWSQILSQVSDNFEGESKLNFFKSFFNPPIKPIPPSSMGSSKFTLNGLKIALENLSITQKYFENLSRNSSLSVIVKNQLYFKTLKYGSGKNLNGFDRIRINYFITDLNDNVLSANHDTWVSIGQLIPGLSHGLKGMKIGEKRQIYIHPSLAYGVLTTLPPCMGLIATIQLIDVDEKYSKPLPTLTSLDLNWITDPLLIMDIEESIEKKPIFVGWFWRNLIEKIEINEAQNIINSLQKELL